jgi:hypothetical protein
LDNLKPIAASTAQEAGDFLGLLKVKAAASALALLLWNDLRTVILFARPFWPCTFTVYANSSITGIK